jgi:transposase
VNIMDLETQVQSNQARSDQVQSGVVAEKGRGLPPEPEVVAMPKRRRFSKGYKRRIVRAAEGCKAPGEIGALLRREGLYSSHLSQWRRETEAVEQGALSAKKRGPKPDRAKAEGRRNLALQQDNARLRKKLERAEQIIEAQKKLCEVLGLPTAEEQGR